MCQEKVSGSGVSRVRSSGHRTRTAPALASFLQVACAAVGVLERRLAVGNVRHLALAPYLDADALALLALRELFRRWQLGTTRRQYRL